MKKILTPIIILLYIIIIFDMITNSKNYNFNENWLFIVHIVLLCIGFYSFVEISNKDETKK